MDSTKIKTTLSATALFLVLAVVGFAQPPSKTNKLAQAKVALTEARKLVNEGTAESLRSSLLKFDEAQRLYREIGNKRFEANSLQQAGEVSNLLGENQKALEYLNQALNLREKIKSKNGTAKTLSILGLVYFELGNSKKALDFYNQSVSLWKMLGEKANQAATLNAIGLLYFNLLDNQKALDYLNLALPLRRVVRDKTGEAITLGNIGSVYSNLAKKEKAFEYFNRALIIFKTIGNKIGEAVILSRIGKLYSDSGEKEKAIEYFNQALPIHRLAGDKEKEALTLSWMQETWFSLNKLSIAVFYGKQAVKKYQELRQSIKGIDKETQRIYLKTIEPTYRKLADILISLERLPEAQAILDLLKEEEYEQLKRSGETTEIIPFSQSENQVVAKIENLAVLGRKQIELQKEQKDLGDKFPAAKQKELDIVLVGIEAANKAFRESLNALANLEKSVETQIAEIRGEKNLQRALSQLSKELDTGVVAIYTVIGTQEETDAEGKPIKDKTRSKFGWVIWVTPEFRQAYPIDVKDLETTVFQFRNALSSDQYNPQPLAEKLYNAIFRQTSDKQKTTLEADLETYLGKYKDKTIMWSLDSVLRYIPMAALHDGKSYLVEKYRNIVFTKQSLPYLNDQDTAKWQTLGLGVSEKREGFDPLPGAEKELKEIVKAPQTTTGIFDGEIRLNQDFTKAETLRLWREGKYSVIHIASHFSFNTTDQTASFLLVGDGKLTFADIQDKDNLFGTVDLLTLSACDTAMTSNGKESEGFPYLAQSLGAKSVIASLWKVSDAGTSELMMRFYQLRKDNPNLSKGEAFRLAQLSLLNIEAKLKDESSANRTGVVAVGGKKIELPLFVKDEKKPFAHPHYWASFVLIGNWR